MKGNGLNDVTCDATSALSSPETRTAADLHIFVETTWQFLEVQPAIAYVNSPKLFVLQRRVFELRKFCVLALFWKTSM